MPPDIDVDIAGVAGCRLVSLDDMQRLAQENNRRKQQALVDAEEILRKILKKSAKCCLFIDSRKRFLNGRNAMGSILPKNCSIFCGMKWTAFPLRRF